MKHRPFTSSPIPSKNVINLVLYLKRRSCYLLYSFLIFLLLMFILLRIPITYISLNESTHKHLYESKRILFVTAHPDDEVMFYGPTINTLRRKIGAENIFLLAMTNGNYEGKGRIRERELHDGFKILNLLPENIRFYKREHPLIDHPHKHLPIKEIGPAVAKYVQELQIDTIITFDDEGVSHHINHGDIFRGISCCWPSTLKPPNILVLTTVNYVRKHSSIFDLFTSVIVDGYLNGNLIFVSGPEDVSRTKESLYVHKSQYTTAHNVLHHFSDRFLYINTLRKHDVTVKEDTGHTNEIKTEII